ncbi:MAG: ChaN family lipoprotein [Candidatus Eremiobacteraeota bacterium]|nr:ChaN family lipoprotein [Candidatus Eremiobacteraeota bacterium]
MVKRLILLNLTILTLALGCSAQPARVLFLGENHRSETDHAGQLEILKTLEGEQVVVAAEMFTVRSEAALNEHGIEAVTDELWEQEWGHPLDLYSALWEWVSEHAVLSPLRPDPAFTKKVKEGGAAVAASEIGEVLIGPDAYRRDLVEVFAAHLPPEHEISEEMLNKYFLIQCFWDDYMAWRIGQLADRYPEHRIVVLVGYGHLHPEYGIPARLGRRRPDLRFVNLAFSEERRGLCDILWTPRN